MVDREDMTQSLVHTQEQSMVVVHRRFESPRANDDVHFQVHDDESWTKRLNRVPENYSRPTIQDLQLPALSSSEPSEESQHS
jgi:hypothetical protein